MPKESASVALRAPAESVQERSAARVLLETFARSGVRVAFGIPGGLISPVYDALAEVPEINLVSTRHEAMAAFFAMGEYLATGVPALVLTTSGPGLTNVITGLAAAMAEEIPLLAIGGEVASHATSRGAFQDATTNALDIVTMLRTVTRWSARLEGQAGAAGMAGQAFRAATGLRPGPVFLSVPIDVARASSSRPPPFIAAEDPALAPANRAACRDIVRALHHAKRPLLVAGNGARSAGAELVALATKLGVPVAVTAHSKGIFPESHPLYLGVIGFGGHAAAREYLALGPDVVCVIGSRLGELATNGWSLPIEGTERTYQIDRDPLLIGRNYPVTMGLVADAREALRAMVSLARFERVARAPLVERSPDVQDDAPRSGRGVHPGQALRALQRSFPDARWISDIGEHCAHAVHHLKVDRPDQFRAMLGLASMGSGIGAAMGLRRAAPDRPVVCVCGDGGFSMHAGEILTCVEQGIDLVLAIMNDGRWNMVDHGFRTVFGRTPDGLPRRVADLAGVARRFGAVGVTIRALDDLAPERLRKLTALRRPLVLDIRVDPEIALSTGSRTAAVRAAAAGGAR